MSRGRHAKRQRTFMPWVVGVIIVGLVLVYVTLRDPAPPRVQSNVRATSTTVDPKVAEAARNRTKAAAKLVEDTRRWNTAVANNARLEGQRRTQRAAQTTTTTTTTVRHVQAQRQVQPPARPRPYVTAPPTTRPAPPSTRITVTTRTVTVTRIVPRHTVTTRVVVVRP